jgi:hypothetical protein
MFDVLAAAVIAMAPQAPVGSDAYAYESTVNLSEIADEIDAIPTCAMEDGSDVTPARAGRCVWTDPDTGNAYLTYEDRSAPDSWTVSSVARHGPTPDNACRVLRSTR